MAVAQPGSGLRGPRARGSASGPAAPAGGTTVINVIGGGKCGQVTMASKYVPNAVAFAKDKGWTASTGGCAAKGYTVKGASATLPAATTGYTNTPVVVTLYSPKYTCAPNPCKNSGTLKDKGINKFACTCAKGWWQFPGTICDKDEDDCV